MESLLGFKETTSNIDENYKLVPWLNWDEWDFVRLSLFSPSTDSVAKALRRIAAWRSRGCLPVAIEVTASIVEIQLKDPHIRVGLNDGASDSEELLAMLYTMAIMRLVNGVIEKTRKRTEVSIAEAAAAIDIPRMLIDIRHEGSHRELPSLRLLRLASVTALNWLKSYYWDPQKNAIPYQRGKSANVRMEIRSKLRELAFGLKVKQVSGSSSSQVQGKHVAKAIVDEWKPLITKFSKKVPELLLSLRKAILDMIESRKAIRDDFGSEHFNLSQYDLETQRIEVLSSLFTWLQPVLKALKPPHNEGQGSQTQAACVIPEPTLIELMRKCLHISDPENHNLLEAAMFLGKMAGNSNLNEKLQKLSLLTSSYSKPTQVNPSDLTTEVLMHQEKHIRQAAERLELLKFHKINKSNSLITRDENVEDSNIWTVAKSWNPCPIGMLARAVGPSGCLPILDCGVEHEHKASLNSVVQEEEAQLRRCSKREGSCDIEIVDNDSDVKRVRETEKFDFSEPHDIDVITTSSDGLEGRLLIDGVSHKLGDQELQDIKTRVRILATRKRS